jgi:hypothetical protein
MFESLTFPILLPPLCAMLLSVVKRVPCHVLETRMSPVMDGRVVSRGLCFTNGNPAPQPSYFSMDIAAS